MLGLCPNVHIQHFASNRTKISLVSSFCNCISESVKLCLFIPKLFVRSNGVSVHSELKPCWNLTDQSTDPVVLVLES